MCVCVSFQNDVSHGVSSNPGIPDRQRIRGRWWRKSDPGSQGGRVDLKILRSLLCAWMSRDGSDRINGLFHLLINGLWIWAVITHFLTIDPNFLGHPRVISVCVCAMPIRNDGYPPEKTNIQSIEQSDSLNCLLSCFQQKSKVRVPGKHRISYQFC